MKNMDSCSFFFFSIFIGGSVLKHAQNAYRCILAYMFYLTISKPTHWHIFCFCFSFFVYVVFMHNCVNFKEYDKS